MNQNADGTVRWFAKSLVRATIAIVPLMIALYTVAFFELEPFWWFMAGAFGSIATNDYVKTLTKEDSDK